MRHGVNGHIIVVGNSAASAGMRDDHIADYTIDRTCIDKLVVDENPGCG